MTWLHEYIADVGKIDLKPPPRERRHTAISGSFDEPSVNTPAAVLMGLSGPFNGHSYAIAQRQVQIGSESGNDLQITGDDTVSAHHAMIQYDKRSLFVQDLHSTNGTLLNGSRLEPGYPRPVNIGDQIELGESLLEVRAT